MMHVLPYQWRLFLRNRLLLLPLLLYGAGCLAVFYLTLRNLSLHQELFEYLRQQSYYTIAGYALFLFLGYESVARVRQRELRECLCAANGGLGRCYLGLAVPLALLALLHFLLFLGVNCLVFAISGVRFAPFWGNMLASTALYFCLAPLAGAALGAGLATLCKGNRLAAYCAFLFLLLMTTSYLYKVWWMPYAFAGKEAGTPWTNFLYAVNDFFTLTPYGLVDHLHEDYLYGLPAEPPRWCLALFWLCAGCLATVQSLPRAQRRRGVSAGLAILLLLGLGGYAIRGGLPRLDMRPNGLVMYNPETYMRWDKNGVPQSVPAEEGGFAIERIEGRLTVGNQLAGNLTLTLSPLAQGRDEYWFTLSHRYRLLSAAVAGQPVPYRREGDYLAIDREYVDPACTLTLRYRGYDPKFYANLQGIALPGYFPYYPMEGRKTVYECETQSLATTIPATEREFDLEIRSPLTIYSNLGIGNRVQGRSRSLTLLAGMIAPLEPGSRVYGSPELRRTGHQDPGAPGEAERRLRQAAEKLGGRYQPPSLAELPAFYMPLEFGVNTAAEISVELGDHLLTLSASGEAIANALFRNQAGFPRASSLADLLTEYLLDQTVPESYAPFAAQPRERQLERLALLPLNYEEGPPPDGLDEGSILGGALLFLMERDGEAAVLARIYDYLVAQSGAATDGAADARFLEMLIKER